LNIIDQIQTNYLRPNRTIETLLLWDEIDSNVAKVIYIYNYEGYHYRIFENVIELSNFLNNANFKLLSELSTDSEVYKYLSELNLNALI
jgi:hypothetical protein